MHVLRLAVLAALFPAAALAQETVEVTVNATRGISEDRPFTLFYPAPMQLVEDGDEVTVATLEYPGAPLQCDAMIADGGPADWAADIAAETLDRPGTEAGWLAQFPGFAITDVRTTNFQSGPALLYRGASQNSPMGVPATVVHAEAVDGGRTYIFECLMDSTLAAEAQDLIDFLLANFSTRADGECCVDPAAEPN